MRPFKESDDDYRRRISDKYGMFGEYLRRVATSSGPELDALGELINVKRVEALVPVAFDGGND